MNDQKNTQCYSLAFHISLEGISLALAKNTSASSSSLKIVPEVIGYRAIAQLRGLDGVLVAQLRDFVLEHGLTFQELTEVITTKGPGSFTALRVQLAAAQALKLSTRACVRAISTFDLWRFYILENFKPKGRFAIVLESKRIQKFIQCYDVKGQAVGDILNLEVEALEKGYELFGDVPLQQTTLKNVRLEPDARDLLTLFAENDPSASLQNEIQDQLLVPLYVRAPDAKKPQDTSLKQSRKLDV